MRVLPVAGALKHCWRSIWGNAGVALRMSWPWMAVIMIINLAGDAYLARQTPAAAAVSPRSFPLLFAIELLTLLGISSIAVNWHRYIFLDEVPANLSERLRLDRPVWRYFGNTLAIIALLALAAGVAMVAAALVAPAPVEGAAPPAWVYALAGILILAAATFFYRLSVKLPAIAIGRKGYGFRNALADTRGASGALAGFVLLQAMAALALAAFVVVLGELLRPFSTGAQYLILTPLLMALNWFAILWNVTVMTSFYGFFAEGRNF
jgi:hypothetical protein